MQRGTRHEHGVAGVVIEECDSGVPESYSEACMMVVEESNGVVASLSSSRRMMVVELSNSDDVSIPWGEGGVSAADSSTRRVVPTTVVGRHEGRVHTSHDRGAGVVAFVVLLVDPRLGHVRHHLRLRARQQGLG